MTVLQIELGLFVAELGIVVSALSAAAGIWIERDREKPLRSPITLTVFVFLASSLGMYQCRQDDAGQAELQENLAKVLEQLDVVATQSEVEVPELNDLLKNEIMIHGRASPHVLMDLARRIAAKGADPYVMLAAYLPEADLQAMKRAGSFDDAMAQLAGADVVPTKRPKLTFGSGASYLRNDPDVADAGTDDAGPLFGVPDDAGVADGGAEMDASVDAGSDEESLKLQIVEARRKAAEAKTPIEKRDRTRELFVLLGTLDKLAKTNAPASSSSASSRFKKPEIEIEEDGTP